MTLLLKLHKNIILTGAVDSYCLVCNSYLCSEEDAYTHIGKSSHQTNLSGAPLLEKHKEDRIIKIKKGYYCIFCNMLLSTIAKVGIHIKGPDHVNNRGAQMLTRIGDSIVAFDEVHITREAWNGFIDKTCVICNEEFEDMEEHINMPQHMMLRIQSKCKFGDNYIYRRIDEESFFCVICNNAYAIKEETTHNESVDHKTHYIQGKELLIKAVNTSNKRKQAENNTVSPMVKQLQPNDTTTPNTESSQAKNVKEETRERKLQKDETLLNGVNKNNNVNNAVSVEALNRDDGENCEKPNKDYVISKVFKAAKVGNSESVVKDKVTAKIPKTNNGGKNGKVKKGSVAPDVSETNGAKKNEQNESGKKENLNKVSKNSARKNEHVNVANNDNAIPLENDTLCKSEVPGEKRKMDKDNASDKGYTNDNRQTKCEGTKRPRKIEDYFDSIKSRIDWSKYDDFIESTESTSIRRDLEFHDYLLTKKLMLPINNNTSWCAICDVNVVDSDINKHFGGSHHLKRAKKYKVYIYRKLFEASRNVEPSADGINRSRNRKSDPTNFGINLKLASEIQNNVKRELMSFKVYKKKLKMVQAGNLINTDDLLIDFATRKAQCKICKAEMELSALTFARHIIEQHKKLDENVNENNTKTKLKSFAQQNCVDILENKAVCKLCNVPIHLDLKEITSHVNLITHKDKAKSKPGEVVVTKVPSKEFMQIFVRVESTLRSEIIVNNLYAMSYNSFHFLTDSDSMVTCGLCEEDLWQQTEKQIVSHVSSVEHKKLLATCNVIVDLLPDNFIREVRVDMYHCGYCNNVTRGRGALRAHLDGATHGDACTVALWNLQRVQALQHELKYTNVPSMMEMTLG